MTEYVSKSLKSLNLGDNYVYDPDQDRMVKYNEPAHKNLKALGFYVEKGVDFGYAITIHKSQGLTSKNVFYDPSGKVPAKSVMLDGTKVNTEANALRYVAMSRASKFLMVKKSDPSLFYEIESKPIPSTLDDYIKEGRDNSQEEC